MFYFVNRKAMLTCSMKPIGLPHVIRKWAAIKLANGNNDKNVNKSNDYTFIERQLI